MKKIYLLAAFGCISAGAFAQSAIDAYRFSQPDLRGTARFMSMGGAFGALGGDLSSLSQNPGGIGVYRSNEIGFTLDLDFQNAKSTSPGFNTTQNQTKFYLDNIGGVATLRLPSSTVPNLNFGFTYNKAVSFNRRYRGAMGLATSMTNYMAGIANNEGITVADVSSTGTYDPYNPTDGGIAAPWLTILGYDSFLINPEGNPDNPNWNGLYGNGTYGTGSFDVTESGSVDEYNIALGGNISNVVFWGMNFDIVNFDYKIDALWGESLDNAYVVNHNNNQLGVTNADWGMRNLYRANGTGFNYQLGVIVKPVQELRLGLAFHTPTWYNLTETFSASTQLNAYNSVVGAKTNNGYAGSNEVNFTSPWKLIVSAAGVIGSKFIISADYEWNGYNNMKFSEPNSYYGYDGWYDYDDWGDFSGAPATRSGYDSFGATNNDVKNIYRSTNTLRVGAEYRITPQFSVRAGYSFVSSPVKAEAANNRETIYTAGTLPDYRFDNTTNYVTCGLGYKHNGFYVDLAYVYKHMNSEYHAFTPDPSVPEIPSPQAKLSLNNSRLILSAGFKF